MHFSRSYSFLLLTSQWVCWVGLFSVPQGRAIRVSYRGNPNDRVRGEGNFCSISTRTPKSPWPKRLHYIHTRTPVSPWPKRLTTKSNPCDPCRKNNIETGVLSTLNSSALSELRKPITVLHFNLIYQVTTTLK